jgi:hypothetical protein
MLSSPEASFIHASIAQVAHSGQRNMQRQHFPRSGDKAGPLLFFRQRNKFR